MRSHRITSLHEAKRFWKGGGKRSKRLIQWKWTTISKLSLSTRARKMRRQNLSQCPRTARRRRAQSWVAASNHAWGLFPARLLVLPLLGLLVVRSYALDERSSGTERLLACLLRLVSKGDRASRQLTSPLASTQVPTSVIKRRGRPVDSLHLLMTMKMSCRKPAHHRR